MDGTVRVHLWSVNVDQDKNKIKRGQLTKVLDIQW